MHVFHLPAFLTSTPAGPRPAVLRPYETAGIAALIRHGAPVRVRLLDEPVTPTPPECPRCKAGMVERRSKRGPCLGCSTFPACRGTRDLAVPDPQNSLTTR